jgi:ABC-type uncharacterized transport system permease subunit
MEQESDLREDLLKQMDREAGSSENVSQELAHAVLEKDMARLRRIKRLTVSSWLLLAVAFLASGITGALTGFRSELWTISSIIGLQALFIIAVGLTFALSVRSRTLKMKQIQKALVDIQDQLKSISQNKAEKA